MNERNIDAGALVPAFGVKSQLKKVESHRLSLMKDIEVANEAHDLVALVGERVRLARSGDKWRGFCPFHGDQRLSTFTVDPKSNRFYCSTCGAAGDALSWIMHEQGLSFAQVVSLSLRQPTIEPRIPRENVYATIQHADAPPSDEAIRQHKREMAEKIWNESRLATHSLVERYLFTRGLIFDGPLPDNIRFHPHLYHEPSRAHYPAMVAAARTIDGAFNGIYRTYLMEAGLDTAHVTQGNVRRMLGECFGAYIHLQTGRPGRIAIAETIESAMTIAQACPELTVWASMALNNFRAPIPKEIQEVIICADSNHDSPHMAERILLEAAREHSARGHRVLIARAPHGMEFNDVLLAG